MSGDVSVELPTGRAIPAARLGDVRAVMSVGGRASAHCALRAGGGSGEGQRTAKLSGNEPLH